MPGLDFGVKLTGGHLGGAREIPGATYGTASSYSPGSGTAAFAVDSTPGYSPYNDLSPTCGFGLAVWVGVAAIVGLVLIRHSLPN